MMSRPRFLQGVYAFEGLGLDKPFLLDPGLRYVVPTGVETQLVYCRVGNSADELVCVIVMRDEEPMRYIPVGAKGAVHVALRVVEDLMSDTRVEVHLAAPDAVRGVAVIDIGMVEV
ncbi:MAG: molybdopterin oxidoreductase [Egibacteraceae bacterium]